MKKVAGKLRLDLAQFRELAAFVQFSSDLDKATRDQINRGFRITEVLKQLQYQPMAVEHQVAILYAVINGWLDDIEVSQVKKFEDSFHQYLDRSGKEVLKKIRETKELDEKTETELKNLITEYKKTFQA